MPDLAPLGQVALIHGRVRLEPLSDQHIEPLRAACAQDPDIWEIYPVSMLGEHFDPAAAFLISGSRKAWLRGTRLRDRYRGWHDPLHQP